MAEKVGFTPRDSKQAVVFRAKRRLLSPAKIRANASGLETLTRMLCSLMEIGFKKAVRLSGARLFAC